MKKIDRGLFDPTVSPGGNFFPFWAIMVPLVGQPHITYFSHAFPDISHLCQVPYTIGHESTLNYCMSMPSMAITLLSTAIREVAAAAGTAAAATTTAAE